MGTEGKVQIWLLGNLRAKNAAGVDVVFTTRKCASLLGYLACTLGKDSARDDLAAIFWPTSKPSAGRNSLSVALSSLRKQFEPEDQEGTVLVCDNRSVKLNKSEVWTDVDEFYRLVRQANFPENQAHKIDMLYRALDVYDGPLMRGDDESWAARERFRLNQVCLEALCHLMDVCKMVPDTHRALNYSKKFLLWNPGSRDVQVRIERLRRRVNIEEESNYKKNKALADQAIAASSGISAEISHLLVPTNEVSPSKLESLGGAVPLDSTFYVERDTDKALKASLDSHEGIVLIKGPRQIGKTSLLARGLSHAREQGLAVAMIDLQGLDKTCFANSETFYRTLARLLLEQLEVKCDLSQIWDTDLGPAMNLERILRLEILEKLTGRFVWALDEVDKVFPCDFADSFFGLLRSWYNARALQPQQWNRLTLAISYATEAQLFIKNLNQSPFNVGTKLTLSDFTALQVADLNQRYGLPLKNLVEIEDLHRLVGGHPYLVRKGLHELKKDDMPYSLLVKNALLNEGPFGDHLQRMLATIERHPESKACLIGVLKGGTCAGADAFYRLRAAGVLKGETVKGARIRCELYRNYLLQQYGEA